MLGVLSEYSARAMAVPAPMTTHQLQRFLVDSFPSSEIPYAVEEVTGKSVRLRLSVDSTHSRPGNTVAGPSLMALADCAAWLVIVAQIGPVALAVTTSLHIDFLRKPALVDLLAVGTVLKLGSRLAVAEVAIYSDGNDEMVAKAQVTYSIPPDRSPTRH